MIYLSRLRKVCVPFSTVVLLHCSVAAQIAPPPATRIRRPRKAIANVKEHELDKEREGVQSTTSQEPGLLDAEESQSLALVDFSSVKVDEAEPFTIRLVINSLDQLLPAIYILLYLCAGS